MTWVEEMLVVAQVDDWKGSDPLFPWSYTLESVYGLRKALVELECEVEFFREQIVPPWIALLESGDAESSEVEVIGESMDRLEAL